MCPDVDFILRQETIHYDTEIDHPQGQGKSRDLHVTKSNYPQLLGREPHARPNQVYEDKTRDTRFSFFRGERFSLALTRENVHRIIKVDLTA